MPKCCSLSRVAEHTPPQCSPFPAPVITTDQREHLHASIVAKIYNALCGFPCVVSSLHATRHHHTSLYHTRAFLYNTMKSLRLCIFLLLAIAINSAKAFKPTAEATPSPSRCENKRCSRANRERDVKEEILELRLRLEELDEELENEIETRSMISLAFSCCLGFCWGLSL